MPRSAVVAARAPDADPDAASLRFWTGRQSLHGVSVCYRDAWERTHPSEPAPTFTPDENPLVADPDWPFRQIDHLLVRCGEHGGPTLPIRACRRIFDDVAASDHYGPPYAGRPAPPRAVHPAPAPRRLNTSARGNARRLAGHAIRVHFPIAGATQPLCDLGHPCLGGEIEDEQVLGGRSGARIPGPRCVILGPMRSAKRPRGFRFVRSVAAVLFSLLLVFMATAELVGGLEHSVYDSQQNRSPGLVIGFSAAATICGFATLWIALSRGLRGRRGLGAMVAWEMLTAVLIVATALIALASGPL